MLPQRCLPLANHFKSRGPFNTRVTISPPIRISEASSSYLIFPESPRRRVSFPPGSLTKRASSREIRAMTISAARNRGVTTKPRSSIVGVSAPSASYRSAHAEISETRESLESTVKLVPLDELQLDLRQLQSPLDELSLLSILCSICERQQLGTQHAPLQTESSGFPVDVQCAS